MIKYKIGFTMTAETLFSILNKFLPVEDLQVEELAPVALAQPKLAQQFVHKLPRRKIKRSGVRSLEAGTNRIILELFSDGMLHKAVELQPLFKKEDYSPNSVGSRLQNLRKQGFLEQVGDGTWRLAKAKENP